MPKSAILLFLLPQTVSLAVPATAAALEHIDDFELPTSGFPAARKNFTLRVGYMHNFCWTQAPHEFHPTQDPQPNLGMACRGVALQETRRNLRY